MAGMTKGMLRSEKELANINYERFKKALSYIKKSFRNSNGNIYLLVDYLLETNNKITVSNNFTLRKVSVKPYEFDKMHLVKSLIDDKLFQITDQFNERKITSIKFCLIFLSNLHPFYDKNSRTCKILFANDDEIIYGRGRKLKNVILYKRKIFIVH